ncbi:MAG: hypothetical protein FJ403_02420 [Verrucomicrobia bacterium]|nr:hypothetical protein [Verrucomicrobiota bacterium]
MISRAEIDELSPGDKMALLDDIWESLAKGVAALEPSEEEKRLLEQRNREIENDPAATVSLEEFKRRLRQAR